jgi:hypothetical protein
MIMMLMKWLLEMPTSQLAVRPCEGHNHLVPMCPTATGVVVVAVLIVLILLVLVVLTVLPVIPVLTVLVSRFLNFGQASVFNRLPP